MDCGLWLVRSLSPPVAIELEPALQALDAALHFGEVVRLATARARGVVGVDVLRRNRSRSGRKGLLRWIWWHRARRRIPFALWTVDR